MGGSKGGKYDYYQKWQGRGAQSLFNEARARGPVDQQPRDLYGMINRENYGYSPEGSAALTGGYGARSYTYNPNEEADSYRNSVYNLANRNLEQQISQQRASRSGPRQRAWDTAEMNARGDFEAQQSAGLAERQQQMKMAGINAEESRLSRLPSLLSAEQGMAGINQQAGQNYLNQLLANEQLQGTRGDQYYKYIQALSGLLGTEYNKKDVVPKQKSGLLGLGTPIL